MDILKKGQYAFEFLTFFGITLVIFTIFIGIFLARSSIASADREAIIASDYARMLQKEIILASQVSDGYSRSFYVDKKVDGIEMNISNTANRLYVITRNHDIILKIPEVEGSIVLGKNTITKDNGIIKLN